MASMTLLDMTQKILRSMSSDEVNSITDTVEARAVADIIQECYYYIADTAGLGESFSTFQLTASTDSTKPTLMTRPTTAFNIIWLKYNSITEDDTVDNYWRDVTYKPVNEFFDLIFSLNDQDDDVGTFTHTIGSDTMTFLYRSDVAPTYYTSFNDNTILFDSYDSEVDTTLQKSKTLAYGGKSSSFSLTDSFTPNLDDQHFSLLLNEAKSLAWLELKGAENPKAEKYARRGWVSLQKDKDAFGNYMSYYNSLPNYGRK